MKKLLTVALILICSICFSAEQQIQKKRASKKSKVQYVQHCKCLNCSPHRCPPGSTAAEKELAIMKKMSAMQSQLRASQYSQRTKVQ